jgi:multiple sugar transport system substrate-binding protein
MPLQKSYYTEPDKMGIWLDNPVHPAETRLAFTDYIVNYSRPIPSYYLRNYAEVLDIALRPAIDKVWNNNASAADAFAEAVKAAEPLMQGRWDQ